MQRFLTLAAALALVTVFAAPAGAASAGREEARLITATTVLEDFRREPDRGLPGWLLERAYGVAVDPGGHQGRLHVRRPARQRRADDPRRARALQQPGVHIPHRRQLRLADRRRSPPTWCSCSPPSAVSRSSRAAPSRWAAAPRWRQGRSAGRARPRPASRPRSIRTRARAACSPAWRSTAPLLKFDSKANRRFYDLYDVNTAKITSGQAHKDSESVRRFLAAIATSANATGSQPAPPPAQPVAQPGAAGPAAPPASGAQTYPMEDPHPGAEPR